MLESEARPGDALFLTKPLGTGLVLTAAHKRAAREEEVAAAVESMTELNGRAAEALRPFEPSAVTDVTGFGLAGFDPPDAPILPPPRRDSLARNSGGLEPDR